MESASSELIVQVQEHSAPTVYNQVQQSLDHQYAPVMGLSPWKLYSLMPSLRHLRYPDLPAKCGLDPQQLQNHVWKSTLKVLNSNIDQNWRYTACLLCP